MFVVACYFSFSFENVWCLWFCSSGPELSNKERIFTSLGKAVKTNMLFINDTVSVWYLSFPFTPSPVMSFLFLQHLVSSGVGVFPRSIRSDGDSRSLLYIVHFQWRVPPTRILFGSWIWIKIRFWVKSLIRIRSKVKIQELSKLKLEPWMAVDAQNGGVETQNGGLEGL